MHRGQYVPNVVRLVDALGASGTRQQGAAGTSFTLGTLRERVAFVELSPYAKGPDIVS